MYLVECPGCSKEIDLTDELPSCACDDELYQCECECTFYFGWYAIAEVRRVVE